MDGLYTIEAPQGPPSIAEAAQQLQVAPEDLDAGFGVILIEPRRGLYTVRVRGRSGTAPGPAAPGVAGPFADPAIGLFGPPQP